MATPRLQSIVGIIIVFVMKENMPFHALSLSQWHNIIHLHHCLFRSYRESLPSTACVNIHRLPQNLSVNPRVILLYNRAKILTAGCQQGCVGYIAFAVIVVQVWQ